MPGFLISTFGMILMSFGMLKSEVFGKIHAGMGFIGGILPVIYLITIAFFPTVSSIKVLLAMPGGLASTCWMVLCGKRLITLAR